MDKLSNVGWKIVLFLAATLAVNVVQAKSLCFTLAETYYQQLYCEIKASGKAQGLPRFDDFRRNEPLMQALLLKQYASRSGIKVVLPAAAKKSINHSSTRKSYSIDGRADSNGTVNKLLNQCEKQENSFRCGSNKYRLVGNRSNQFLNVELLEENNKMSLPVFKGLWSANDIDTYLQASYYLYLQKMMAIGLGGATLSYGKFSFLFYDLNEKGVNFTERFEVMYKYLKKDKKTIAAPAKSTAPDRLAISDCYPLQALIVCQLGINNWLFERQ